MELDRHIEAVLFYKAEPVKKPELARILKADPEAIETGLQTLSKRLETGALRVVATDETVSLATAPDCAELIEALQKDELRRGIGKAGAETLSIILYRGPISRAQIDKIRGVNSAFILRNLLIRGLIERRAHPKDQRTYQYAATTTLLSHLGITRREELPEFQRIMDELDTFESQQHTVT